MIWVWVLTSHKVGHAQNACKPCHGSYVSATRSEDVDDRL